MGSKVYVVETTEKNIDGEEMQIVKVLVSKPKELSYIVFLEK